MSEFQPLRNKKALIFGIANDQSIAYGCTKAGLGFLIRFRRPAS